MVRCILVGLCFLVVIVPYAVGVHRPRGDLNHHRHRRQAFGPIDMTERGAHMYRPGMFPRPPPCSCAAVICPAPLEVRAHPQPHRIRPRFDMDAYMGACMLSCCPNSPICPIDCGNGGTRVDYVCSCRTGFTGLCCERQVMCPRPSVPSHGSLSPSHPEYVYGEVVTYTCDAGYRRNGDARRVCQLDNTWSGTTPTCTAITCGSPGTLTNGRVTPSGANHAYGTVVTFRCNAGYRLIGGATRTCQGLGAWTGSVPRCQIISCQQLSAPANGNIQVSATTYGGVATYSCREGFLLSGSQTRTCQADGNWSGAQPSCSVIRCPSITAPDHGVMLSSNVEAGTSVNFQCIAGCRLVGSQRITCRLDGTWSGQKPTCQVCPANQYKAGTNAITSCTNCPSNSHTTATVNVARTSCVCNENYRGPNGGPCQLIQCSHLSAPPNAVISSCSTAYRGQCHFSCTPGHVQTDGDATRTCGVTGSWSGTAIVCTACEADTYSTDGRDCLRCPAHSHTQGLGTGPESCVCDTGFIKNTNHQCEDINECSAANGGCDQTCENTVGSYLCRCTDLGFVQDEEDFRRCVPANQCPALPTPANGGYVCVMQRRTNTQRCQLKCDHGFEHALSPNMYEECGPNTNWRWSYELMGDEILPCREEIFPGLVFDSEVFFFVTDCASLTPAELAVVMEEFLAYLVASGLCTDTGLMACSIVDVSVECHADDTTPSGTLQSLGVNVRLAVSGVDISEHCGQACETRQGCQQCALEYSHSAIQVLQSQAMQVAAMFSRDFSHDMRLPALIREADYHNVQIQHNFEMEQEFYMRLEAMAAQHANRYNGQMSF